MARLRATAGNRRNTAHTSRRRKQKALKSWHWHVMTVLKVNPFFPSFWATRRTKVTKFTELLANRYHSGKEDWAFKKEAKQHILAFRPQTAILKPTYLNASPCSHYPETSLSLEFQQKSENLNQSKIFQWSQAESINKSEAAIDCHGSYCVSIGRVTTTQPVVSRNIAHQLFAAIVPSKFSI